MRIWKFLSVIVFFYSGATALACSCLDLPPYCNRLSIPDPRIRDEAIFVGKVIDSDPLLWFRELWRELSGTERFEERRVRLRVTENFLGANVQEFEVFTNPGWGGGDCGVPFKWGEAYFVVAHLDSKSATWGTSICSRTRPVKYAAEDVAALRAWKRGAQPPRDIYGYVNPDSGPLSLRLTSGDLIRHATSDRDGKFVFPNLQSAQYYLDVDLPERRLYIHQYGLGRGSGSTQRKPIDLMTSRCAELYVSLESR